MHRLVSKRSDFDCDREQYAMKSMAHLSTNGQKSRKSSSSIFLIVLFATKRNCIKVQLCAQKQKAALDASLVGLAIQRGVNVPVNIFSHPSLADSTSKSLWTNHNSNALDDAVDNSYAQR